MLTQEPGPKRNFSWNKKKEEKFIPQNDILLKVGIPKWLTRTKRSFTITQEETKLIIKEFELYQCV